jgi:hypothetical protein
MDTIKVAVQAYILGLFPQNFDRPVRTQTITRSQGRQLDAIANGLAVPSFWSAKEIEDAFAIANKVWGRASIEFAPITITKRSVVVPADEDGMWIAFVNKLSPRSGVAAAFVHDLPSDEGGWGGGKIAIVSGKETDGALPGYAGSVLAHEIGHMLFDSPDHEGERSNLMFGSRNPKVATADLLEGWQIEKARRRAVTLA